METVTDIGLEPVMILDSQMDRQPLIIENLSEVRCKLILNEIAGVDGQAVEINLPSKAETNLDGSYKGQIWAKSLSKTKLASVLIVNAQVEEEEEE